MRRLAALGVLGALLLAAPAAAHQDTTAYSGMVIRENGDVEYSLKIPVEDLAEAVGRHGHTSLNAPEVRAAEELLFRHFQPLVGMTSRGQPCPVERNGIDVPEDYRLYGELRFIFHCAAKAPVTLDYRVFFDIDPGHVGVLNVESTGGKSRAELIIERPRWEVSAPADGPPQVRAVATTAAPQPDKSPPVARAKPTIAAPAGGAEQARPEPEPETRKVPNAEEPGNTASRNDLNWIPVALVLVVAMGAFLAVLRARRRPRHSSR